MISYCKWKGRVDGLLLEVEEELEGGDDLPVHKSVDLELGFVEGVLGRGQQLLLVPQNQPITVSVQYKHSASPLPHLNPPPCHTSPPPEIYFILSMINSEQ